MLKKVIAVVLCSTCSLALAEQQRVTLTHENKVPALHQLELGYDFEQTEYTDLQYRSHALQARFGLIENLTARLDVPYVMRDEDFASDESGLGDISLGFDLVAHQDVFSYPYVIPHVDIAFASGDDKKGLGAGDTSYVFGFSVGTVVYDQLHYVADLSYAVNHDARASDEDDAFMASLSMVWDVNERFAVSGEGRVLDFQDTDTQPYLLGGGMAYSWSESLLTKFFLGTWQKGGNGEDLVINVSAAYQL